LRADATTDHVDLGVRVNRSVAMAALALFFAGLIGLPVLASAFPSQTMALVDSFYRSGSLVFGGGHVVLPLLQSEVVGPGWVSKDAFLAGYGAAQAVPGPLFTFAAYLGTVMTSAPNGIAGGLICLLAIYASSFLLVIGAMPFWDALRRVGAVRNALLGVNEAGVGLLLAAPYDPVWTSAILSAADIGLALAAFTLLVFWKTPRWLVVILTAPGGLGAPSGDAVNSTGLQPTQPYSGYLPIYYMAGPWAVTGEIGEGNRNEDQYTAWLRGWLFRNRR
jgi:chromate transporter